MRRALLLIPLLVLSSCDGTRPPTPRKARLGQGVLTRLAPLRAEEPRPARGFLLPGLLHEAVDDRIRLDALLDGDLPEGASLQWHAEGGKLTVQGATALLQPEAGSWAVTVQLVRGTRVSAEARAVSSPERTVDLASLMGASLVAVPLSTENCTDLRTPMRLSLGHVGCSPGDSPTLDRFLPFASADVGPLPNLPRRTGKDDVITIRPTEASIGAGILAWAGDGLGTWSGDGGSVHWLPRGPMLGPPAVGPAHLGIVRSDRIEIAKHGSSQRTLLPLAPLEGPNTVALHHPWLALVRSDGSLYLRDLAHNRGAVLAGPGGRSDLQIDARWLTWEEAGDAVWLNLITGELRRLALDRVRGRRSGRLDDLLLVPTNAASGVELTAVHLPTGERETMVGAQGDLRVLGAAAGGVTVAVGPFGGKLKALSVDPTIRQLEETSGLTSRQGGSGGRHAWLDEGSYTQTLAGGGGRLTIAVRTAGGEGRIDVSVGGVPRGGIELVEGAEAGWIDLAGAVIPSATGQDGRRVEVRWTAGPGGLGVDAVRLVRGGGA